MLRFHLSLLFILFAIAHVAKAQGPTFKPSISLLDGQSLPLKEMTIAGGKVAGDGLPENLALDDLRQINVAQPAPPPSGWAGIHLQLAGGGLVLASSLTIENDVCQVATAASGQR